MDSPILDVSLGTEPKVGSNLRGEMAGGGWLYGLPRLEHERIVVVGRPPAPTLAALARAGSVCMVEPDVGRRRRLEMAVRRSGLAAIAVVAAPVDVPIDLLVLAGRSALLEPRRSELLDRLAPDGLVYIEPSPVGGEAAATWPGTLIHLALTPFRGETRAIVPAFDGPMLEAVRQLGLEGTVARRSRFARIERRLARIWPLRRLTDERRATMGGPGQPADRGVPRYLRDMAAGEGRDLEGWRWAVAARGDYDSQKILVLLAAPGDPQPGGVVKVTRSSTHAARLHNEARALRTLAAIPVAADRVPVPWFSGSHAGRAVLGASRMTGEPYLAEARYAADDPLLGDALGWLTDLAQATARPRPASEVADALLTLLGRYERIYRPSRAEADGLRARFERVGELRQPLPVVIQHGDPGIWNLLVDPRGRTVFLDWEAAEMAGLPLWDLLYLFRSYAIAASRREGVRDRLEAASRHLLDASPLADRLVDAVDDYRRRIDLPLAAIEPLVYGCWLHRSLKEASRLPAERLDRGQFVRLIRRMLDRAGSPTMARLSGSQPGPPAGSPEEAG